MPNATATKPAARKRGTTPKSQNGVSQDKSVRDDREALKERSRAELAKLAGEITAEHKAIKANLGRISAANEDNVECAIRIGDRLHAAKAHVRIALGARQWMTWIKQNFDGSHRLVNTYTYLAENKAAISQDLAKLGIEGCAAELRKQKRPKTKQFVSDWAGSRAEHLHRAVEDVLSVEVVVDYAIQLAPEADRERLNKERDVMAREVRTFLGRAWPTTKEPHPTLFPADAESPEAGLEADPREP